MVWAVSLGTHSVSDSHGRRAVLAQLDVGEPTEIGDVVDQLIAELGGIDVFVNNAGMGIAAPFLEAKFDDWRRTLAVDLDGPFLCLQRAAAAMVEQGRGGRLIAVTSVHEHQPGVGSSAYVAAKHGLGGLMKTIAVELGQHGITANAVAACAALGLPHLVLARPAWDAGGVDLVDSDRDAARRVAVQGHSRVFLTTGRSSIRCMPSTPDCGGLMIGVDISEPNTPPLVMVKVPPCMSSMVRVPSFARRPKSPMTCSISETRNLSASRITGTTRPCGADTATEMSK